MNNYEVASAPDGLAALPLLKHGKPHVLLSDLQMPHMNGYELLRIARRFFPEVGAIAVSGAYDPRVTLCGELADARYAKGAVAFPELLERVDQLARQYPVRPPARVHRLWPSWVSQEREMSLLISCHKCEQYFVLEPSLRPNSPGIYGSKCPHCHAKIAFCLESSSLQQWTIAA